MSEHKAPVMLPKWLQGNDVRRGVWATLQMAFIVLSVLTAVSVLGLNQRLDSTEQTLGSVASVQRTVVSQANALEEQVRGLGQTPVVKRQEIPPAIIISGPAGSDGLQGAQGLPGAQGSPGPTGKPGRPPTNAEVEQAVSAYCAKHTCATPPSPTQVAVAISTYCDSHGQCAGKAGANGADGVNGADGLNGQQGPQGEQGPPGVQGEPGRNATAEQVAAAVSAYCGQDSQPCTGQKGPKGDTGPAGDPFPFSFTYTRTTGQQVTCTVTSHDTPGTCTTQ